MAIMATWWSYHSCRITGGGKEIPPSRWCSNDSHRSNVPCQRLHVLIRWDLKYMSIPIVSTCHKTKEMTVSHLSVWLSSSRYFTRILEIWSPCLPTNNDILLCYREWIYSTILVGDLSIQLKRSRGVPHVNYIVGTTENFLLVEVQRKFCARRNDLGTATMKLENVLNLIDVCHFKIPSNDQRPALWPNGSNQRPWCVQSLNSWLPKPKNKIYKLFLQTLHQWMNAILR